MSEDAPVLSMEAPPDARNRILIPLVFWVSGASAIVYQIVWQRSLLTLFGSSSEAVTLVVSVFMLGLGLGSLAGGRLSRGRDRSLPYLFAAMEAGLAGYGLLSLPLFRALAEMTAGADRTTAGLICGLLLLVPTLLMGGTLPVLVAYLARRQKRIGSAVGRLYAVNTVGSALGALLAALWLMGSLGQSGAVLAAAAGNVAAAAAVLAGYRRDGRP